MSEFDVELERAKEYRRKEIARAAYRYQQEAELAGNETAYNELLVKQSALRNWQGWTNDELVNDDAF